MSLVDYMTLSNIYLRGMWSITLMGRIFCDLISTCVSRKILVFKKNILQMAGSVVLMIDSFGILIFSFSLYNRNWFSFFSSRIKKTLFSLDSLLYFCLFKMKKSFGKKIQVNRRTSLYGSQFPSSTELLKDKDRSSPYPKSKHSSQSSLGKEKKSFLLLILLTALHLYKIVYQEVWRMLFFSSSMSIGK